MGKREKNVDIGEDRKGFKGRPLTENIIKSCRGRPRALAGKEVWGTQLAQGWVPFLDWQPMGA